MEKQIPIYFDSVVIESPLQEISESNPNLGRLKVRVFTKYGNRNGSYITDKVALQLIESATNGMTPVVGFFDPDSKKWAGHSGPTLANAYGYVESFLGWEPFQDTDGVTREYAVFSVVLFTNYFEEAKKVLGQNQSMELDPQSITGDWTLIDDEEFYVYKTAKMLGFCIIGEHEPCFSVSAFFSKNDSEYSSQFEKFSSLLSDLKAQVEEADKNKGGEQPMNEFENQEQEVLEEEVAPQEFEKTEENVVTEEEVSTTATVEFDIQEEEETVEESTVNNFETLYNELQTSYNELQENYNNAQNRINELENSLESNKTTFEELNNKISNLEQEIATFTEQFNAIEINKKEELIKKYEKVLSEEEISIVRADINNFSYEELNSKLAVIFAESKISNGEIDRVPLPEQPESQFALFMKKYKKN